MQVAVHTAAESTAEPFERLARGIRAYLTFFDENPHYVELLIQERAIFKDRKGSTYFEYRKANIGPWRELYTRLAAEGRIRADIPVERILDTVGSLLYGTMFTNHFVGRLVPLEEQYRTLLDVVLFGLLSPPVARPSRARYFATLTTNLWLAFCVSFLSSRVGLPRTTLRKNSFLGRNP